MSQNFEYNLANCLAHTIVLESKLPFDFRCEGGDPKTPNLSKQAARLAASFQLAFPKIYSSIAGGTLPTEQARLATAQATAPGYAQLESDIFGINQNAILNSELAALQGPGANVVRAGDALGREIDPSFYSNRAALGQNVDEGAAALSQLFKPIGDAEREEITRSVNRSEIARGTNEAPSNINTAERALTFAGAARDRFSQALASAAGFLPAATATATGGRTLTDPRAAATTNPAIIKNAFGGAQQPGEEASSLGTSLLGALSGTQIGAQELNATRRSGTEKTLGALPDY